jgi:transforming growth factor-beta-induced protein
VFWLPNKSSARGILAFKKYVRGCGFTCRYNVTVTFLTCTNRDSNRFVTLVQQSVVFFPTPPTNGAVVETLSGESVNVDLVNGVFINDAAVIAADNVAANGVVHVIDKVLLPTSATTTIFEIGEDVSTGDEPAFTTLMLLVDLADAAVKDALESNGPITLFAPTDAAFAKLDQATLVFLTSETKEAKAALTEILTYHVVSGNVASTSLTQGLTATTVQGENIIVSSLNPPTINGNSLIIDTDILASNGIIHVINTVLLPKDFRTE